MPITPLHFGINGTVSSLLSRRIDILSCILANVLLDIQPFLVIFFGADVKLHGLTHSLLFGVAICLLFFTIYGFAVKKFFNTKKPISSYVLGGVVGGVLHVFLDSFYHSDVLPFYPFLDTNFAYLGLADTIVLLCLIGYITFFVALTFRYYLKKVREKA